MTTYRYNLDADGVITRGSLDHIGEYDYDLWSHYWDGDTMVGFYEEYARGRRPLNDSDDCERAISAYQSAKNHGRDPHEALDTLAVRLTGNEDSRFIAVSIEPGVDLYVLAWSGDPDNSWRDEIEYLNYGEVYRIAVDKQVTLTNGGIDWYEEDDWCEDYYGEGNALAALEKMFPLAEYPAEVHVAEDGS